MRESPETIGDAILLYVRKHYGSQSAAAIAWHCSPTMLSEVVRGTRRPTERMLSAIGYCHVEVWMPVSDRLPDSALPLNAAGVATDAPIKAAMEACRPILARLKHQDGDEEAARALDMVAAALGVRACPSCGARSQCDAENLCHGETCPLPDTGDDFDAALGAAGVATTTATDDLLETLEDMARQHCLTNGNATSSGALSTNAYVLRLLAKAGRFRIARESGRMVIGYWPENEPESGAGVATDQQENKHG